MTYGCQAMRSMRQEWRAFGREVVTALLTIALFLQAVISGDAALRAATPAFDPWSVICSYHPDRPGSPDRRDDGPPDHRHALCCTVLCGFGNGPPPALPPAAAEPVLGPGAPQAAKRALPADERLSRAPLRRSHRARAPPATA